MAKNIYIIKSLAPWMVDELLAFSKLSDFELVFLREQNEFYHDQLETLKGNGVKVSVKPFALGNLFRKILVVLKFVFSNLHRFFPGYNFVIGFKSILWFLRLDLSKFSDSNSIHAQFATQAALVAYLVKKYNKESTDISFTFHAYDIYFNNKWFALLTKESRYAFSISEYNIAYVKKTFCDAETIVLSRLGVFREALSASSSRPAVDDRFKLGLISWFVEKKGIIYLLKAMKELKDLGKTDIELLMAGDGPLKDEFEEFVAKHELQESVQFCGKIKGEQKIDFFKGLDVFVLPSITLADDMDGIPVVLMEAIASSLPLISTNVSGIPEICKNDFNGKLIEEKRVSEIVSAIVELHSSPDKRAEFAKNSLELSSEFDIQINSKNKLTMLNWLNA